MGQKSSKIRLGFEIGSGREIFIEPSHLIVTGITQQSGKTTTLEALIQRSSLKAIVFKTKPGEKSFTSGTMVAPFFRERSDYEFVRSLIEAYTREKIFIEKGALMTLCKGSKSLLDIKMRVDEEINKGKLRGIKEEIYTRLQHYLENLIPQIQYANFSSVLNIGEGINIMDLERFSDEAQSLIIRSVADEVLKTSRDTILVIPEAWKFIPQKRNNPCKVAIESYVRQGATNKNFIWIDSQDMSNVDKTPLKQISTWILGYQSERNEVAHTLDQISLPQKQKPKEDDIMKLSIGQFYLSSREQVVKVYVQPAWLEKDKAWKISTGEMELEDAISSKPLPSFNIPLAPGAISPLPQPPGQNGFATKKEVAALRLDFFNKIDQLASDFQNGINNLVQNIRKLQPSAEIDEDHLVSLVLQKLPPQKITGQPAAAMDIDAIVAEVVKKIPRSPGAVTYQVAPLEKIKKDFLQEIREKIIGDVEGLNHNEKTLLKFMETREGDIKPAEIISKCFMWASGGPASARASAMLGTLVNKQLVDKTPGGRYRKALRKRIESLMGNHKATDQEMNAVYDHILATLIG